MGIFNIEVFLLVLTRIASFFVVTPLFSSKNIPAILKIGFSFLITILVMLIMPNMSIEVKTSIGYYFLIMKEAIIGLFIGYISYLIFSSIQMAGQLADRQVGFSMAESYDPMTNIRSAAYGNIYNWISICLFLGVNAHHYLISGIVKSFQWAPLGAASLLKVNVGDVVTIFSQSFLTAFQIAVPTIIVIFMADVIMGMIARTVPQINVFILGMPLKVIIGFLVFLILVPSLGNMMISVIEEIPLILNKLVRLL
ncbi:MAG: flagellar biosynthetic protein FliR [Peptostreptococcales bacterium]